MSFDDLGITEGSKIGFKVGDKVTVATVKHVHHDKRTGEIQLEMRWEQTLGTTGSRSTPSRSSPTTWVKNSPEWLSARSTYPGRGIKQHIHRGE